jgi:hypothetical protein
VVSSRAPAQVPQGRWDKIVAEIREYARLWTHQVTIHDPEWGPHRLIWERLMLL